MVVFSQKVTMTNWTNSYRLSTNATDILAEMGAQRKSFAPVLAHLRVGFNRVPGYYIEISRPYTQTRQPVKYISSSQTLKMLSVPLHLNWKYWRQSVSGQGQITRKEKRALRRTIRSTHEHIKGITDHTAKAASAQLVWWIILAERADILNFVWPRIKHKRGGIPIIGGCHPVVEAFSPTLSFKWILNSMMNGSLLDDFRPTWGQSPTLRQICPHTLLAQYRVFFVPAESAFDLRGGSYIYSHGVHQTSCRWTLRPFMCWNMTKETEPFGINASKDSLVLIGWVGRRHQ